METYVDCVCYFVFKYVLIVAGEGEETIGSVHIDCLLRSMCNVADDTDAQSNFVFLSFC